LAVLHDPLYGFLQNIFAILQKCPHLITILNLYVHCCTIFAIVQGSQLRKITTQIFVFLLLVLCSCKSKPPETTEVKDETVQTSFKQLTTFEWQEKQGSLSHDAQKIVFAADEVGNWDIYLQRLDGQNYTNLTENSKLDDLQPAFSPDGKWIAFRSDRDGGGIFLMEPTGKVVKQLTDFGYFPSWSPDGKQIVLCTQNFQDPYQRGDYSDLWIIDVETGRKKQITSRPIDAIQPSWSRQGNRIVFWSVPVSQRDLYTISPNGGQPVQITNDRYLDWSPTWSPDGMYVYFSSDRGGSLNLWRIPIIEQTGKGQGKPEPVSTPARSAGYFSFSSDGTNMVYTAGENVFNIAKVDFDPLNAKVNGTITPVTSGSRAFLEPEVSPDGEWLVFRSRLPQEDLYIVGTNGRHLRKLTDDPFKDRSPHWLPDGKRIVFQSDRLPNRRYEIWLIHSDGSGLEQITSTNEDLGTGLWDPQPSPDGTRILTNNEKGSFQFIISGKTPVSTGQTLPRFNENTTFVVTSWSPDGKKVIGSIQNKDGEELPGMYIFTFDSGQYEKVSETGFGGSSWLKNGRGILHQSEGKLYLLDSRTKVSRALLSPPQGSSFSSPASSNDDRIIYFVDSVIGSDIWLMKLK
jgi:Tol biopolymer transport system component